ncbi:hypothetical protein GPECTOR_139g668 [Gonium pectorale]|uniref:Uncharacterized protein n=1 Tax=Gonium pectorale TaxID=33097 RepID=A0A150FY20_GONPE|nr:hypothetical protein GPECTOR_139g668 [Gonium pectorale]|eukprot:KXZ42512.1 hypothetical protein GPECTOR_139g668 [Gonium pectorale]
MEQSLLILQQQYNALNQENFDLRNTLIDFAVRHHHAYRDGLRDAGMLFDTPPLPPPPQQQQGHSTGAAPHPASAGANFITPVHYTGDMGGMGSGPQHPGGFAAQGPSGSAPAMPGPHSGFQASTGAFAALPAVSNDTRLHHGAVEARVQPLTPSATSVPSPFAAGFGDSSQQLQGGFALWPGLPATYPAAGGALGGMAQAQFAAAIVPGVATQPPHGPHQEIAAFHCGPSRMVHPGAPMPPAAALDTRQTSLRRPPPIPPSPAGGGQQQGSAPSVGRHVNARSGGSGSIMRDNGGTRQRSSPSGPGDFGGGGGHY